MIIPFSTKKKIKFLFLSILLIPIAIGMIVLSLSSHKIRISLLGISLGLLAGGFYLLYQYIKDLIALRKSNEGVILTPEYLESHTNIVGKEVGKILWSDIASIERKKVLWSTYPYQTQRSSKYVGKN